MKHPENFLCLVVIYVLNLTNSIISVKQFNNICFSCYTIKRFIFYSLGFADAARCCVVVCFLEPVKCIFWMIHQHSVGLAIHRENKKLLNTNLVHMNNTSSRRRPYCRRLNIYNTIDIATISTPFRVSGWWTMWLLLFLLVWLIVSRLFYRVSWLRCRCWGSSTEFVFVAFFLGWMIFLHKFAMENSILYYGVFENMWLLPPLRAHLYIVFFL